MRNKLVLIAAAALLLSACNGVEDDTHTTQQLIERDSAPSEYMSIPVMTIDSVDLSEGYAFGFNDVDGWHWAKRIDAPTEVVVPVLPNAAMEFESVFDELDVPSGGGQYSFRAASGGSIAFSAQIGASQSFLPPQAVTNFSAETRASLNFSTAVRGGGSCDLAQLCDFAASFVSGPEAGYVVSECRRAIYSIEIPTEVAPLVCAIIDYAQCVLATGLDFESAYYCAAPFVVVVDEDYNNQFNNQFNNFNNFPTNNTMLGQ